MKLRHLSQRIIITALLFGLCATGTLIALNHARSVNVSAASSPYFMVTVGGQKYTSQYAGGGSSNQHSSSIYDNFGQWNEYIIDGSGRWNFWGQFSGTGASYFDSHGKVVGGINANVPGIGHVDTYGAQQTLGPDLPALQYPLSLLHNIGLLERPLSMKPTLVHESHSKASPPGTVGRE